MSDAVNILGGLSTQTLTSYEVLLALKHVLSHLSYKFQNIFPELYPACTISLALGSSSFGLFPWKRENFRQWDQWVCASKMFSAKQH